MKGISRMFNNITFNRKLFMRFFMVLILCISMATIAVGTFSYYSSAASIKEEVGLSNLGQLRQASLNVDLLLAEVNRTAGQFVVDSEINSYGLYPSPDKAVEVNSIASKIGIISHWNKVIHSIYIYFENSSRTVSSIDGSAFQFSDFYDKGWMAGYNYLRYSFVMPTRKLERISGNITETANIITLLRAFPMTGNKNGAVIINIDEEILTNMIRRNIVRSTEQFIVSDEEGNVLLSSDKSMLYKNVKGMKSIEDIFSKDEGYITGDIDGKNMLITYTVSPNNQWRYYSIIPTHSVYGSIKSTQLKILIACLVLIILGVIISSIVSARIYKPINKLVEGIRSSLNIAESTYNDEVKFLSGIFGELFGEKSLLEQKVADSMPVFREKFFKTLITSNMVDDMEFKDKVSSFQIPFTHNCFQFILFEISKSDRSRKIRTTEAITLLNLYIRDLIEKELSSHYSVFVEEVDAHNIGAIINFKENFTEQNLMKLMELCKNIVSKSIDFLNIRLFAGIGKEVEGAEHISISYSSALEALKYKHVSEVNRVIYINDVEAASFGNVDLMYDKENLLVRYLKAGDKTNSDLTLHRIMDGLKYQKIPDDIARTVVIRLLGTLEATANELEVPLGDIEKGKSNFLTFSSCETIDEMSRYLESACDIIINNVLTRKKGKNWVIIVKVEQYVADNLDKLISVEDAASSVGLSNSYFSKIFKEETGSTFVEYLTGARLKKAKELLETTDMKVSEISEKVGFSNNSYFIAQFKNSFGVTPKNYKEILAWKGDVDHTK